MNDRLNITMRELQTRQRIARNEAIKDTIDALVASGALGEDDLKGTIDALKNLGWKSIPANQFAVTRLAR